MPPYSCTDRYILEELLFNFIKEIRFPYGRWPVNNSLHFTYAYVDITFSWWDIATKVYGLLISEACHLMKRWLHSQLMLIYQWNRHLFFVDIFFNKTWEGYDNNVYTWKCLSQYQLSKVNVSHGPEDWISSKTFYHILLSELCSKKKMIIKMDLYEYR